MVIPTPFTPTCPLFASFRNLASMMYGCDLGASAKFAIDTAGIQVDAHERAMPLCPGCHPRFSVPFIPCCMPSKKMLCVN